MNTDRMIMVVLIVVIVIGGIVYFMDKHDESVKKDEINKALAYYRAETQKVTLIAETEKRIMAIIRAEADKKDSLTAEYREWFGTYVDRRDSAGTLLNKLRDE